MARRWSARRGSWRSSARRGSWRGRWASNWRNRSAEAGRTETSRRRWAFPRWMGWARWARARTQPTRACWWTAWRTARRWWANCWRRCRKRDRARRARRATDSSPRRTAVGSRGAALPAPERGERKGKNILDVPYFGAHNVFMSAHATLRDAVIYFAEFENCRSFMMELRWPDGVVKCPQCGSEKTCYLAKNRLWKCYNKHAKPRFTLKTGTIFEDSPIPLEKWLPAVCPPASEDS